MAEWFRKFRIKLGCALLDAAIRTAPEDSRLLADSLKLAAQVTIEYKTYLQFAERAGDTPKCFRKFVHDRYEIRLPEGGVA